MLSSGGDGDIVQLCLCLCLCQGEWTNTLHHWHWQVFCCNGWRRKPTANDSPFIHCGAGSLDGCFFDL